VIKLLAKLRIVMLRRREKERKRGEEKKRFDALSHKQEVLPTVKYDPGVAHRFPRSVKGRQARNRNALFARQIASFTSIGLQRSGRDLLPSCISCSGLPHG